MGKNMRPTSPNSQNNGNYITTIELQADGKILIGASRTGASGTTETATVVRLLSTGALDSTFGVNGYADLPWGAGWNYLYDLAIQSDGKILVAGRSQATNATGLIKFAASRLSATGSIDSTYGTSGMTLLAAPCTGSCLAQVSAKFASDNSVYFIGAQSATYNYYTAHLSATGSQDLIWGNNGFTTDTATGAYCNFLGLAINSSGQVAGQCGYYPSSYLSQIVLYDSTGSYVPTFGSNGIANPTFPAGTGLAVRGGDNSHPTAGYFAIDNLDRYTLVGSQGNNFAAMRILGSSSSTATQSSHITLDTTTSEVGRLVVDSATSAGYYYQTLIVTDSMSVTGSLPVLIKVAKAPGVTITASSPAASYYSGDTLTTVETVTTTGLVAGDTVTITYKYKAPSTDTLTALKVMGDTYTISPVSADTFTITPLVTAINHGSVSGGVLGNYLSTTYVTGTLRIARGTRTGFAINSSSGYAYAYVGAPLLLSVINARDTGTVVFTLIGSNCALDTNTLSLTDTGTTSATCIVSATIARTANWETTTTQTTFYFQSYVNYYPSPADGSGSIIALSGQVGITTVAGAPTITSAQAGNYDSTTTVIFTIVGTGFGTTSSAVQVQIGRKLGTISSINDGLIVVAFPVPPYGDNVNWGKLSVTTPVALALVAQDYISGKPWSYNWVNI